MIHNGKGFLESCLLLLREKVCGECCWKNLLLPKVVSENFALEKFVGRENSLEKVWYNQNMKIKEK